jgi:hypothetical protein
VPAVDHEVELVPAPQDDRGQGCAVGLAHRLQALGFDWVRLIGLQVGDDHQYVIAHRLGGSSILGNPHAAHTALILSRVAARRGGLKSPST